LFGLAAAVRLLLFTGLTLGDDVFYLSAAAALAEGQGWPPLPLHWHTRLGVTLPTAAGLVLFGWHPLAIIWLPLAAGLAGIGFCYYAVRRMADEWTARVTAIVYAATPLEIIYGTHLFPDVIVGVCAALSVWLWVEGIKTGSRAVLLASGLAAALGYFCRETIFMVVPVYFALWFVAGRIPRTRALWAAAMPAAAILAEATLYFFATGDALYRWRTMADQQASVENLALIAASASGGNFWTDPLLMLITSHELGVLHMLAVPLAILAWWRRGSERWVAVWLLVGLGWLYYGTTVPGAWVPMHRDPRYATPFTLPAALLIAVYVTRLTRPLMWTAVAGLVVIGVLGASLDQRSSELAVHRTFASSSFAGTAALEPFEYYGARWASGMRSKVDFACASDTGRESVVRLARTLPDAAVVAAGERRYFVYSPKRRPDLEAEMSRAGWHPVSEIAGPSPRFRRAIADLLRQIPTQEDRAARLALPPLLVILERPALAADDRGASVKPGSPD
jgi:hypothetical protein